jgi:hypothetical protein
MPSIKDIQEKLGENFVKAVNNELRKLADENPQFVYNPNGVGRCQYNGPARDVSDAMVGPDCKGCIFGQALQRLGWDDSEEMGVFQPINELIPECPSYWNGIQQDQDRGKTWEGSIQIIRLMDKNEKSNVFEK